jgi:hypothetical protein
MIKEGIFGLAHVFNGVTWLNFHRSRRVWHVQAKPRVMSNSGLGGYVAPQKRDDVIDLQVLCLNGEGYALKVSGSCMGWEVCRMVSKELPPRKGGKLTHAPRWLGTAIESNVATAGYCGQGCDTLLHLHSDGFVCCIAFYPRGGISNFRCKFWLGRGHFDSRYRKHKLFAPSPAKPSKPDLWKQIQFKLGRSNLVKQSSDLDIWLLFQQKPGTSDSAKQSSKFGIWQMFQPKPGTSDPTK